MEYLYVCQFSTGLIKVGRSITPAKRVAAHVERIACAGVELLQHSVYDCEDKAARREGMLIERCAKSAATRRFDEWFEGLEYAEVCRWAAEFSQVPLDSTVDRTRWTRLISQLRIAGWSQSRLAREFNVGQATINRLANGQQADPMFPLGEKLIALHASVQPAQSC